VNIYFMIFLPKLCMFISLVFNSGIGEVAKSIKDYELALDVAPTEKRWDIQTRLSLGHYYTALEMFNSGDYRESENQLSICINYNPKVSEYYAIRGKTRYLKMRVSPLLRQQLFYSFTI